MDAPVRKPYVLPPDAVWFSKSLPIFFLAPAQQRNSSAKPTPNKVTGCSSGIGQALAQHIASKAPSNRVVATARNPATLSPIPDGPNVLKLALDVTSEDMIDAAFDAALSRFGRVDVVVNNAGYSIMGDAEASPRGNADARALLDTNFWGAVDVTKRALGVLRDANANAASPGAQGGVVLNVSSMGGFFGSPGSSFYHASKFALEGFAQAVDRELDPAWNIHVCNVEPGGVRTKYASSIRRAEPRHPAYVADPGLGTNRLLAFMADEEAHAAFAEAADVASAMYELVSRGGRIPIRLPLGRDAYGMLAAEVDKVKADIEEFKELSCSMGQQTVTDVAKLVG
ncbi:hypothetical protein AAE478_005948 [Parahypoxylon ruwenzoriense]